MTTAAQVQALARRARRFARLAGCDGIKLARECEGVSDGGYAAAQMHIGRGRWDAQDITLAQARGYAVDAARAARAARSARAALAALEDEAYDAALFAANCAGYAACIEHEGAA